MGIKLSNAKIKLGNRTPLISNPFNIVTNMQLDISLENGEWFFSLNGFTDTAKEALMRGQEKIYIQLNRFSSVGRKRTCPIIIEKGAHPNGFVDITPYTGSKFQRINLTNWMNDILYALSCARTIRGISINKLGSDWEGRISNGLYYTDISFTVVVGMYGKARREHHLIGTPLTPMDQYIRLNFYNALQPINTNYTMSNNTIDIYAQ